MLSEFITESVFSKGLHVSKADDLASGESVNEISTKSLILLKSSQLFFTKNTKLFDQHVTVCLQTYLEEFKYKNTVYSDLWKHLQMVR